MLILVLGVSVGSLLMLFILHKLDKSKILQAVIRSLLGGSAGFLVGFMIDELLAWIRIYHSFYFPLAQLQAFPSVCTVRLN